jgi:uncharacterized protein (TIRG00374 family)
MSEPPGQAPSPKPKGSSNLGKILGGVVAIVVIVGIFGFAIPKVANYSAVWTELQTLTTGALVAILGFTLLNIVTYWWVNMAALPGLGFWQSAVATLTPNAIASTLPAGPAVAVGVQVSILHSWGFVGEAIATMIAVGGVWNVLGKFVVPVIALVFLVIAGEATKTVVMVTLVGVVFLAIVLGLFALILWKESLARRVGDIMGKAASAMLKPFHRRPVSLGERVVEFRSQTVSVASRRWPALTAASVANQISAFLILLVAFRGLGVTSAQMHWTEAFAAFAGARVVSSIPITPGGAGIAEASFIGAFVAVGAPKVEVVAAVLLFRFLTWMVPIPFGVVTFFVWRRKTSWRKPQPTHGQPEEAPA